MGVQLNLGLRQANVKVEPRDVLSEFLGLRQILTRDQKYHWKLHDLSNYLNFAQMHEIIVLLVCVNLPAQGVDRLIAINRLTPI